MQRNMAYMASLAPLQALDELGAVRHGMGHGGRLLGRGREGRAVWHRAVAQLGPDALLGEAAAEPPRHGGRGLDRARGSLGTLREGVRPPGVVVLVEDGHLATLRAPGSRGRRRQKSGRRWPSPVARVVACVAWVTARGTADAVFSRVEHAG